MKFKKAWLLFSFLFLIGGFSLTYKNYVPSQICEAASVNNSEADNFITYWRNDVRGVYPDICSMPKEKYDEVYLKYVSLSPSAKAVVDSTIDVDNYTIKDTMNVLINKFAAQPQKNNQLNFDKNTVLTIIIVVGVLGMTSICGLYFMKTKKVIQ